MASLSEVSEDHIEQHGASLESVVAPWPIAASISQSLPVGDLISLARTNIALRASLHGFGNTCPDPGVESTGNALDPKTVREYLNIGFHDTLYWSRLKDLAPFQCASDTHTKGDSPRPCRFCSRPICEACIVKDSFLHPKENTFNNRCVSMCPDCWDIGNISRSRRFPLASSQRHQGWYGRDDATDEVCTCTLKKDAYLCIPCKNLQNSQAVSENAKQCHGYGCNNSAGEDARRRRVCTWCHKPLPGHRGGAARLEWNQKIIEARKMAAESRQADLEEYNTKRLKLLRMSRRELRGKEAVEDDPDADTPQYVRHLDTFNYRRFMPDRAAPTGDEVYQSKKGHWTYSRDFLKHFGSFCASLPINQGLTNSTRAGALKFARSNLERRAERRQYRQLRRELEEQLHRKVRDSRMEEWHIMKAAILEMRVTKQNSIHQIQSNLLVQHMFMTDLSELEFMLAFWGHSCVRDRSRPEIASEQPPTDQKRDTDDLTFATELQKQIDRETAEALQYCLFDEEELDEEPRAAETSSTRHSSTDEADAQPQIDSSESTYQPENPAMAASSLHRISKTDTQRRNDTLTTSSKNGSGSASQGEDSNTIALVRNDDPPPYKPPSSWPHLSFDEDSKKTRVGINESSQQESGEAVEASQSKEQTEGKGKGKGKGKEISEEQQDEGQLTFYDFGDSQDDSGSNDSDEGSALSKAAGDADVERERDGGRLYVTNRWSG